MLWASVLVSENGLNHLAIDPAKHAYLHSLYPIRNPRKHPSAIMSR